MTLKRKDLLPIQDTREVSLRYVIAVLFFLASMAFLIVLASNRAATGWSREIRSEVTVQVRPTGLETGSVAAARAAEVLAGVSGVKEAAAIEPERAKELIKPWLGDAVLEDLPLPNLVEVRLDDKAPAKTAALSEALAEKEIDATIDDHSTWLEDIEKSALIIRLISISIFLLIASAAAAVVGFATRAGLTARANIVEVLSLCGATDLFIARRFQYRFARMAGLSGLFGAGAAGAVMAVIKVTAASQSFLLALPFSWLDLLVLIPCPLLAAVIAAFTARTVTLRMLGES
ncbi:ABC transporter permease [Asticcacaulis sp. BYS171W]|uniref:ABC transporter permease n=1 Tax=Asticcacaulis aquaticus TaxID=2984212 RepID=A0ABT5HST8_9CAUL|nr:ABC transporter permease [Asticcacaulis aquaticus]MDC7683132.1 ABC transporter permease [Asticcacaulis aquaticus]